MEQSKNLRAHLHSNFAGRETSGTGVAMASEMMPRVRRDKQKQAQKQNHDEEDRGEDQHQCSPAALAREMFSLPLHLVRAESRTEKRHE
jgi:hypothetical protein